MTEEIKVGDKFLRKLTMPGRASMKVSYDIIRVMAVAEGYAMLRVKGCIPYVMSLKDIIALLQTHQLTREAK